MSTSALRFALVGNPNCGKTSLFNHLTGARAKVANYPGVTVERRAGMVTDIDAPVELMDLPGTYSLHVSSLDEKVARDMILGQMAGEAPPDVLVAVVDATNLRLGLRLVLELEQLGRPMMLAINQMDAARRRGIEIDTAGLQEALGIPVIETIALRKPGSAQLRATIAEAAHRFKEQRAKVISDDEAVRKESVEAVYDRIETLLDAHVRMPAEQTNWQDALDRVVMHPVAGLAILFTVLLTIFQAVFAWASPVVDLIDGGFGIMGDLVATYMPDGILKDFVVDGLIAGVGGVLVFLPQIVILFFFILLLEDSGYLTRAAFLLDRPMRGVGLSGRSFIPLLSSFACAVPGIMSTRTVPDPRERMITIMVAPLMTCSARLPVYTLIIAAFIPEEKVLGFFNLQGLTLFGLYLAGIVSAAAAAWVLRLRHIREEFPLLLELPSFRWPSPYHLLIGLRERIWIFLRRVGTVILALSVLLWALASFPAAPVDAVRPAIEYSFAGQLGALMQPLFAPMGFNWQMCVALIPAMAAREVAVSALATVYAVGAASSELALGQALGVSWELPVALAYLAWFVYAPQCLATIAVVRRETNSNTATAFFTVYLFALAYLAAMATYQIASLFL
ncbi:ferrous iron transporter B [Pseudomaricurvus sp. HS19]|uniref:ferrous iron transporter B n=1 Tax=Pseudomaricurvus sp. HS19 TaxID=2692626 RepID=UPI00136FE0BF|nr:ferrous iron transporter B [Pseudomaricurvus sp. HS19]MYM63537.1 ferrous iron transporter B [Pseudomaricurvus sp. HS19]